MFKKFYNLDGEPFSKGPETAALFMTRCQEEALARLGHVAEHKSFGVLTGDCGTGKTTILRSLRDSADPKRFDFLYLADSKLTPRTFYNGLLSQLGLDGAFYRGDSRRKLHQEIETLHLVRRRWLVVIVDEAHLLDAEMLEELRFLLNFRMDSENPISLVLSGQTELEAKLDKRSSTAIRQRIDFLCRLAPLTLEETSQYIEHHLSLAGAKRTIFTESSVKEVHSFSGGAPRLINKACLSCMMYGSANQVDELDGDIVKEVIEGEFKFH
jgi:type II secretory pathway predicted ATPase ExeA